MDGRETAEAALREVLAMLERDEQVLKINSSVVDCEIELPPCPGEYKRYGRNGYRFVTIEIETYNPNRNDLHVAEEEGE